MLHVGYDNYVQTDKIAAIANIEHNIPAPLRRAIKVAEAKEQLIILAAGRKIKSVIFLNSGQIVLSGTALKNRAIDTNA